QYHQASGEHEVNPRSLAARLAGLGWAVWFYLYKALLPVDLAFVYPRWRIEPGSLTAWLPNAALVLCGAVMWLGRRGWGRGPFFALSYFVLMLFPVLGLFNIYYQRYSFVADHWQYFSIIGVVALVVGAAAGLQALWGARSVWGAWVFRFAAALLALVLGALTWRQAGLYRDAETLWRDTLKKNPDAWLAHNNLGILLGARGELDPAERHFREATRIEPGYAEAYCNLGIVHARRGHIEPAVAAYRQALERRPDYPEAHNNLGAALLELGQTAEAIAHFAQAVRSKPDYRDAHQNLVLALARAGRLDEAAAHLQRAIALGAPAAFLHRAVADAFAAQKNHTRAIAHYRAALAAQPDFADALNNLAWLLATCSEASCRNGAEAVRLAERAVELTRRSDPHTLGTLAAAYAETGQFERAVATVRAALALAEARGQKELAAQQRAHLECYLAQRAYREP
ncbi:MAG: tetratricopeptide repeat protein, partial [Verrucomicrobiales bacterium]|nr:tetratricopeptide repeat protein [Verrucomicrobiales bacterium]